MSYLVTLAVPCSKGGLLSGDTWQIDGWLRRQEAADAVAAALGRAVQVDPIKPTSKAPGTKRLKLKYDEVL